MKYRSTTCLDMGNKGSSDFVEMFMSRQVVDLYFKKMQDRLGFRIHAHKFRHTFAVKAIMDNVH